MNSFDSHNELAKRADAARKAGVWEPEEADAADGIVLAACIGSVVWLIIFGLLGWI